MPYWEEDKKSEESRLNSDNALMRFEFVEMLLRIAVLKHVKADEAGDPPKMALEEAAERLMKEAFSALPPDPVTDADFFRQGLGRRRATW